MQRDRSKWLRALVMSVLVLALAAPVALAASAYKTGSYKGKGTESNDDFTARSVKFSVGKGKIKSLKLSFTAKCHNHDTDNPDKPDFDENGSATASKTIKVKRNGSFLYYFDDAEVKAPGDPRLGRIFFKGKLKGGKAEGTVMVSYEKDVTPGYDDIDNYEYGCGGGIPVKFKAKR